jgi:hypothetical protein
MAVDHFLLPRMFRISRPLVKVPSWEQAGLINWPATLALLVAVFFGVTGTASWPSGWSLNPTDTNSWGPVPLEAWAIAGVGYLALVAVARALGPVRGQLGFAKTVRDDEMHGTEPVDIATGATPTLGAMPATAMEPTDR